MKQAQSATATARTLLAQKDDSPGAKKPTEGAGELDVFKKKCKDLETELAREKKDKEALKSQAESLNREYDRLTDEYSKLQNKKEKAGEKSE